jgi:transglutaminase-like putative cysteine protease
MKYHVRHLTTYRYSEPVQLSHHAAHLSPRQVPGQLVYLPTLKITPDPAVLSDVQADYFGNPTVYFTIQDPHNTLTVEAGFMVETSSMPTLPNWDVTAWDKVRDNLKKTTKNQLLEIQDFLYSSPLIPLLAEAKDYAMPSFVPGRPITEAVLDLNTRIHQDFIFDPVATEVGTTLPSVFADRRGVCQDFAHVTVACIRAMGLAARYVSGYIRTTAPLGKEKLVGADASHAWASIHIPGWGWLDIDPTNNTLCGEDHITVAWGRDYDDVSPIRGVVLGGGNHHIDVAVDVTEIESTPAQLIPERPLRQKPKNMVDG